MIELENVRKTYVVDDERLDVLKDVSIRIEEGEFVAIMGPSGSGKSTLMQIMGLLDRPTSGTSRLLGIDVSRLDDDQGAALRSRLIGFIFQMFNLLARTSARDNVALPMIYSGAPEREARAAELLRAIGLGDRLGHSPNQLSGGQQQRVAIARASANHPRLIFADEPTGNLASEQARDVLRRLVELNRAGITVVMVTHEAAIAAYARRIVRIADGKIVADETNQSPTLPLGTADALVGATAPFDVPRPRSVDLAELGENLRSALTAMRANKARSALSMLGVLIGVWAVIAMVAIGRGAQKSVEAKLSSLGSNLLMVYPNPPRLQGGARPGAGSFSTLSRDDVAAIGRADPGIVAAAGEVSGSVQAVYTNQNANTTLAGGSEAYAAMHNARPYYGRFFTAGEVQRRARVALLGRTVVAALFGRKNPVGKIVNVNHVKFRVIGVLPRKGSGGFRDEDDVIVVPLTTAMRRILGATYLGSITIECRDAASMPEATAAIRALMRRRHHLPDYKDDDFTLRNMAEIRQAISGTTATFTLLLGIVAAISLLVGGIGIMNIMLVSVSERTREIGLRKAVGATRRAVLSQFLTEAAVLSTLGGVLGIMLGAGTAVALSAVAGWAAVVSLDTIVPAFLFSACVGVVFGFWPARKASLLSPIEALRYE